MIPFWFAACGTSEPASAPPAIEAAPADFVVRAGKVAELAEGGGYTYARLDACGRDVWVAGPQVALTVGATVNVRQSMVMTDFESPTLKRKFDRLYFVEAFEPVAGEPDCNGATASAPAPAALPAGHPPIPDAGKPAAAGALVGTVVETMGGGGYTYVELDVCGQKQWVAGPEVAVKKGDVVSMPEGFVMPNFESKSLGRTFDALRMVDAITPSATAPSCP